MSASIRGTLIADLYKSDKMTSYLIVSGIILFLFVLILSIYRARHPSDQDPPVSKHPATFKKPMVESVEKNTTSSVEKETGVPYPEEGTDRLQ